MNKLYTVKRTTSESEILVTLDFNQIRKDYKKQINSGIIFLNHMIEQIIWRSGFNIEIDVRIDEFDLGHLVCEDAGITFGKAIAEYLKDNMEDGINGYGYCSTVIDEAKAETNISFEDRTYFNFYYNNIAIPHETEKMLSEDLITFLEGFAQGARCTLHIDLHKGQNGHHIWEAIFRSLGGALSVALAKNEKKKGITAGVAGTINYHINKR